MLQRCYDPNCNTYERYGARGIGILWQTYEEFRADMLSSYKPGLQIERIDNSGHYGKTNCRWATAKEQAYNRRSNLLIEFKGETMALGQWAERLGIKPMTISQRIRKLGWSVERALTTKVSR